MRLFAACLVLLAFACSSDGQYLPKDGDVVFQMSQSAQSRAIQLATGSPYSHMGIVYLREGEPYVFEAVQPVKLTPLRDWIKRGAGIEIGTLANLGDFDLSSPAVKEKLQERFGDSVPLSEIVISPSSMFESPMLETVFSN